MATMMSTVQSAAARSSALVATHTSELAACQEATAKALTLTAAHARQLQALPAGVADTVHPDAAVAAGEVDLSKAAGTEGADVAEWKVPAVRSASVVTNVKVPAAGVGASVSQVHDAAGISGRTAGVRASGVSGRTGFFLASSAYAAAGAFRGDGGGTGANPLKRTRPGEAALGTVDGGKPLEKVNPDGMAGECSGLFSSQRSVHTHKITPS
jgi:hypothetical protein